MSGIVGFCNLEQNYLNDSNKWISLASKMVNKLSHRGSGATGTFATEYATLAHSYSVNINQPDSMQPIIRNIGGKKYAIVLDGVIFNAKELKDELASKCCELKTSSDAETVLNSYICFGEGFAEKLNGVYAFVIWDEDKNQLFLCKDRFGIKPLFYSIVNGTLVFASEIKSLFEHPEIIPRVDLEGLTEIFAIGPARTEGYGVFKGINELESGNYAVFNKEGYNEKSYWKLSSVEHKDNYDETVEYVRYLITDSVMRQLISDGPICSFLSGGLDSSVVTAIASKFIKEYGFKSIDTFSFDYEENSKYFKSNKFQPDQDRPWVDKVSKILKTNHRYLECGINDLVNLLESAVIARDLPGMADVDSSILYFCKEVKKTHSVALTGECADEVFGGYPWFHSEEAFSANTFPWTMNIEPRKMLLSGDLLEKINIEEHISARYEKSIKEVPKLYGESGKEARRREIAYINLKWFMRTLLDRMDRASQSCGLDARVPFADHRLVEYIWNVPWEMKSRNKIVKGLLREATSSVLPAEIINRQKSPFPKTYNPLYEKIVAQKLKEVVEDSSSPILPLIDKQKVLKLIETPSDYGKPWFGQLMAGPQLLAYLLQINFWLKNYKL